MFGKRTPASSSLRRQKTWVLPVLFGILTVVATSTRDAAGQSERPSTPTAEMCRVRSVDTSILLTLASEEFVPAGVHDEADDSVADNEFRAISAVIVESIACSNANLPLAALALFTDRYLIEAFASEDGSDELGHLIAASSREAEPASAEDQLVLISIADPRKFTDGRVAVHVTTRNAIEEFRDVLILQEIDGEWLIDEVIVGDDVFPTVTPVASSQVLSKTVG